MGHTKLSGPGWQDSRLHQSLVTWEQPHAWLLTGIGGGGEETLSGVRVWLTDGPPAHLNSGAKSRAQGLTPRPGGRRAACRFLNSWCRARQPIPKTARRCFETTFLQDTLILHALPREESRVDCIVELRRTSWESEDMKDSNPAGWPMILWAY